MADPKHGRPPEQAGEAPGGFVADAVRKAVLAGVGALFLTEEGARRLAREWKLPKDLIAYVGAQAAGAKTEILRIVSDEVRRFLQSEAVRREFVKALSSLAIEVKAEIRLTEPSGKARPAVTRLSVRPKGKGRDEGNEGGDS
jgi:hypothetical protein